MSEIILHVGTHKTGTTTIQDTLFHNRALLRARGLVYPRIGQIAPHHNLVTRWIDLPPQFRARGRRWRTGRALPAPGPAATRRCWSAARNSPGAAERGRLPRAPRSGRRLRPPPRRLRPAQPARLYPVDLRPGHQGPALRRLRLFRQPVRPLRYATGLALDYNLLLDHLLAGFAPERAGAHPLRGERRRRGPGRGLLRAGSACRSPAPSSPPAGRQFQRLADAAGALARQPGRSTPGRRRPLVALAEEMLAAALGPGARSTLYTRGQVARMRRIFLTANRRFEARAREIDPDFAMAPLRLHPDTIHRDDLDAAGSSPRCAGPRPRASPSRRCPPRCAPPSPAVRRDPAPCPAPAPRPPAPVPPPPSPRRGPRRASSFRTRPGRSPSPPSGWWSPGRRSRPARTWRSGPSCTRASPEKPPPTTNGRTSTGCTSTTSPAGSAGWRRRSRRRRPRLHPAQGHPRPGEAAGLDLPPRLPLPLHGGDLPPQARDRHRHRRPLPARLRRGARRLPLVPDQRRPALCAQYHPLWDWDFDRVITLNIDQIELDAGLNAVEAAFGMAPPTSPRIPPSRRCAGRITPCRPGSISPARSRTTASLGRSAASRAGSSSPRR